MRHQHILLLRLSAIGDVAMLVPVVQALAQQYPSLRISVVSRPFARPLFTGLAPNVEFMEADVKVEYTGVKGLNSLFRRLVAKHPTAVADMHDVLRTKFLIFRFNVGGWKTAHINKHRGARRLLCRYPNKVIQQLPTQVSNYAAVLEKLGYPIKLDFHTIYTNGKPPIPQSIGDKPEGKKWIGIAPFAAHKGKIWPLERIGKVIEAFPEARIFLFGGGGNEEKQMEQWGQSHPNCTIVRQHLHGLDEELSLMSRLDVMLSMDSANMHLASLVATPVVSVWGATSPLAGFMGINQSKDNLVELPMECRPCSIYGNKGCARGDYACLYGISPDMIIGKINNVLNRKAK